MISIQDHFKVLLDSGEESDVVVECGKQTWNLHRCILRRSPWFERALNGCSRRTPDRITLHEFPPDVIHFLLEYIYTGKLDCGEMRPEPKQTMLCFDLFYIGDFFLIPEIKWEGLIRFSQGLERVTRQLSIVTQGGFTYYQGLEGCISIIRAMFTSETPARDECLPLLMDFLHRERHMLFRNPDFAALFDEIPTFACAMLKAISRAIILSSAYYEWEERFDKCPSFVAVVLRSMIGNNKIF